MPFLRAIISRIIAVSGWWATMNDVQPTRIVTRHVSLAVRAPRVAVFINHDAPWTTCLGLVQTLTETWGGATFAIIPTDGRRIDSVFWGLIRRHDPDWFVQFGDINVTDGLKRRVLNYHSVPLPEHDEIVLFGHKILDTRSSQYLLHFKMVYRLTELSNRL